MSTTTQKPTNGKAPATGADKQNTTSAVVVIDTKAKPETVTKTEAPQALNPATTVDSQLKKLLELSALSEKREKLLQTQDNLKRFRVASDERTNTLTIKDGKGSDFVTGQPVLIGEIIEHIKKDIETKMEKVNAEIVALG